MPIYIYIYIYTDQSQCLNFIVIFLCLLNQVSSEKYFHQVSMITESILQYERGQDFTLWSASQFQSWCVKLFKVAALFLLSRRFCRICVDKSVHVH